LDIKTTFLHGILEEQKNMDIPMGLKQEHSQMICKIYKSLYGLKKSSVARYQQMGSYLISIGLIRNEVDSKVYMMKQKGKSIIILIYIDDVMVVSNTWILIQQMKKTIESEFEMVGLKKNHLCIGIQMTRNQIEG